MKVMPTPRSGVRTELARLNEQFSAAKRVLEDARRPEGRLAEAVAELDVAEAMLVVRTRQMVPAIRPGFCSFSLSREGTKCQILTTSLCSALSTARAREGFRWSCVRSVSYTHLTLPTNREV